jgi:hypothetical protein
MDKLLGAQVALLGWYADRRDAFWAWARQDDGQEAGVEKLILIGAAIAIAVAAGVFFVTKFGEARDNVDDPVKITVSGG